MEINIRLDVGDLFEEIHDEYGEGESGIYLPSEALKEAIAEKVVNRFAKKRQ